MGVAWVGVALETLDRRVVVDVLGEELTMEGTGSGACGEMGSVLGLGGDAANGVYSSTAAPDSPGEDLKHVSMRMLLTVAEIGCSLEAQRDGREWQRFGCIRTFSVMRQHCLRPTYSG